MRKRSPASNETNNCHRKSPVLVVGLVGTAETCWNRRWTNVPPHPRRFRLDRACPTPLSILVRLVYSNDENFPKAFARRRALLRHSVRASMSRHHDMNTSFRNKFGRYSAAGMKATGRTSGRLFRRLKHVPLFSLAILIVVRYRRHSRVSRQLAALQSLHDFDQALLAASLEPSSMVLDVLEQVRTVMRARRAELILAEPSGIPRRISLGDTGASGVEPITLDQTSFVTEVIATGKPVLHNNDSRDGSSRNDPIVGEYSDADRCSDRRRSRSDRSHRRARSRQGVDSFDNDDLRLFETLVANASASLERARLVEELRYEVDSKSHQATHDMLTGLPNRTLFLTRAASALSESHGVAIVLLDINRFKDVNDTLGHAIGDRLLCEISERLLHAVSGRATVAGSVVTSSPWSSRTSPNPTPAIDHRQRPQQRAVAADQDGRPHAGRDGQCRHRHGARARRRRRPAAAAGRHRHVPRQRAPEHSRGVLSRAGPEHAPLAHARWSLDPGS